ncbi:MAG: methyltransferase domain-containing protein [Nostoc sp.]|uniref:class I SAM-dependent methyltransferase n=1 Tax=Nostoc sp. TaxID=1180 RepID=UPI002FFBF947
MAQNIYDDQFFFEAYGQLPRSIHGLDGAPEWSALRRLLPPLQALSVLDLGCGFGWFSRWAAESGAESVLAVDLSERMLARARAKIQLTNITFERADLETLVLPRAAFDLVYSSLVLRTMSKDCLHFWTRFFTQRDRTANLFSQLNTLYSRHPRMQRGKPFLPAHEFGHSISISLKAPVSRIGLPQA